MNWELRVTAGPRAGETIDVDQADTVLGRGTSDPGNVDLRDPAVSRRHAEIAAGEQLTIRDLGSRYGTVVDGRQVGPTPVALAEGSSVHLGNTVFVVQPRKLVVTTTLRRPSRDVLDVDVDLAQYVVEVDADTSTAGDLPPDRVPLSLTIRVSDARGISDLIVDAHDRETPLADVLGAITDASAPDRVWVDGREVDGSLPLIDAGVANGSLVELDPPVGLVTPRQAMVDLVILTGPWSGSALPLAAGRQTVGVGAESDITVDGGGIAAVHAELDVSEAGEVAVRPIHGAGVTVNSIGIGEEAVVRPTDVIGLGDIHVAVRPVATDDRPAAITDRLLLSGPVPFNRQPRPASPLAPATVVAPRPATFSKSNASLNVVAIVTPLVIGAVLVLVLDSLLFAVFMLMSPIMAIGGYVQSRQNTKRARRSHTRETRERLEQFESDLGAARQVETTRRRALSPDPAELLRRARQPSARLWERRPTDDDFLLLSAGIAEVGWEPPIDARRIDLDPDAIEILDGQSMLAAVPAQFSLAGGAAVGIVGDRRRALAAARALIGQAVVLHGPVDMPLVVLTDATSARDWEWTKWLPHADALGTRTLSADTVANEALIEALLARSDDDRHHRDRSGMPLVVLDDEAIFEGRRSAARRLLRGEGLAVAGVVIARSVDRLPASCTTVIQLGPTGVGRVDHPQRGVHTDGVAIAALTTSQADQLARGLARFEDPDLHREHGAIPERVTLWSLLGMGDVTPERVLSRWTNADRGLWAPIGAGAKGTVGFDLSTDGPHGLVGGTTGSGKSELLRSMLAGLALSHSPDDLTFLLLDFKGGGALEVFAAFPHCVGLVTSLDVHLAERALLCIQAELRRREAILQPYGGDIVNHQASNPAVPLPRLVVVADEFAELKAALPDFVDSLVSVAAKGRSLGVHLVLATQRPSGAISPNIRENTNLRIALRTLTAAESNDVIDEPSAASISHRDRGRAFLKVGNSPALLFQTAISGVEASDDDAAAVYSRPFHFGPRLAADIGQPALTDEGSLTVLRGVGEAVRAAFHRLGSPPPPPVAPDPLPLETPLGSLLTTDAEEVTFALADDPSAQRQYPVGWSPKEGHLLLYGVRDADTSNGLAAVGLALASRFAPSELHLYVMDLGAGATAGLVDLPHTGAWVGSDEAERQARLVRHLFAETERRQQGGAAGAPAIVVLVDGLGSFIREYRDVAGQDVLTMFERVFADGPEVGIRVVGTANHPTAVPRTLVAQVQQRLVFRLADPHEYAAFGIPSRIVPEMPPNRAFLAERTQLVQVGWVLDDLAGAVANVAAVSDATAAVPPIERLPDRVSSTRLPAASLRDRPWRLPVGVAERDLSPCDLVVYEGEHLLVVGPSRSGRSTTLALIGRQVRAADPDARLIVVRSSRSPLSELLGLDHTVVGPDELDGLDELVEGGRSPDVVLIDDAEQVPRSERFSALLTTSPPHLLVAAATRADGIRGNHLHWLPVIRRSNLGILLRPDLNIDGDLLNARLPRRTTVPLLVGRGFVVNAGEAELAQIAVADSPS